MLHRNGTASLTADMGPTSAGPAGPKARLLDPQ